MKKPIKGGIPAIDKKHIKIMIDKLKLDFQRLLNSVT